jgi:PAP2 superfamily
LSTAVPIDARGSAATVPSAEALAQAHTQMRPRTRWWVEALTVAWLCWVYDAITNLAPLRLHAALTHAHDILSLEQSLHIDPERTLDRWLAGHHTLGLLVSDYYDNAHFVVTLGLLGYLWWRRADIYRPLRNSLVLANVIAFVVFWLFPVAPPRMLPGFVDVVASTHAIGSWHTGALASAANQLAAMPSLHIAWAVWCTLVLWRISTRRWVRALAVIYPCVTAFAVLSTGNHYVLDVLGGLATIALSVLIVRLLGGRLRSPEARVLRGDARLAKSNTPA